jgi:hypothetical protein
VVLTAIEALGLIPRMPSNCHRLLEHGRQEPGEDALVEHVLWHLLCHRPCSDRWDNFYSFGLYDGKQTPWLLTEHAQVRAHMSLRP